MGYNEENRRMSVGAKLGLLGVGILLFVLVIGSLMWFIPAYSRYQARMDETNQIQINALAIQQTQQLVEVEKQKALIREQEAIGIAQSQKTINATLTPLYIQHEAIQAQEKMANSPNHTEIYIPSGMNGVPLVPLVQNLNDGVREDTGKK